MPRTPEKKILLLLLLLASLFSSCDSKRVYDENRILEKGLWKAGDKIRFEVGIPDPAIRYNIILKLRHGPEYPFSNLFLFMTTVTPDQRVSKDTLELTLADYDGRWLGSGIGSVKFDKFLLQQGVQFRQKGKYVFQVEQAMRVKELTGIRDFGLRIEQQ